MKYCWRTNAEQSSILAPAVIMMGVMCLADICRRMWYTENPVKYFLVGFTLCFLGLLLPGLAAVLSHRQYQIDDEGLTLRYPFGIVKRYGWDAYKEIALCKVHYASASTNHILAIRCALIDEKRGPKRAVVAKERWSTIEYEIIHFGKIITIYYTEERYAEFVSACPYTITDYRYLEDRS